MGYGFPHTRIILHPTNLTKNKPINDLYSKFLKFYKVPKDYLNILSNDEHLKYYNTEKQQNEYINKWLSKSI